MMLPAITDGELKVLEVLWRDGPTSAGNIARDLQARTGWNRNTTYTFINRLVEKGVIARQDPGYLCTAAVTREQVGVSEGRAFLNRMFYGSLKLMLASFVTREELSPEEVKELHDLIDGARETKK